MVHWSENDVFLRLLCLQIMQHKWSWPFLDPVDVEGLGLTDYFEVSHVSSEK